MMSSTTASDSRGSAAIFLAGGLLGMAVAGSTALALARRSASMTTTTTTTSTSTTSTRVAAAPDATASPPPARRRHARDHHKPHRERQRKQSNVEVEPLHEVPMESSSDDDDDATTTTTPTQTQPMPSRSSAGGSGSGGVVTLDADVTSGNVDDTSDAERDGAGYDSTGMRPSPSSKTHHQHHRHRRRGSADLLLAQGEQDARGISRTGGDNDKGKGDHDGAIPRYTPGNRATKKAWTPRSPGQVEAAGEASEFTEYSGAFYTLVPIRPRRRGERRSLRTFAGVSLRPPLGFNPHPRRLSTPPDAFQLHPAIALYGTTLRV
jgi:hypothetical protein